MSVASALTVSQSERWFMSAHTDTLHTLPALKQLGWRQHAMWLCSHIKLVIKGDFCLGFPKDYTLLGSAFTAVMTKMSILFQERLVMICSKSNDSILRRATWSPVTSWLDWFICLPPGNRWKLLWRKPPPSESGHRCEWQYIWIPFNM